MFKCGKCNRVTKPNEKPEFVVEKTRKVEYTNYLVYPSNGKKFVTQNKKDTNKPDNKTKKSWTTKGTEIVSELLLCKKCSKKENKR